LEELARFATAFMDGGRLDGQQVLLPAVIARLSAAHVSRPSEADHYGYGLSISDNRGVKLLAHNGSRTGYGSTIRMAPEHHTAVIILTNRSGSSLPKTAARALEMVLPLKSAPASNTAGSTTLSESEMAGLVGVYSNRRQEVELSVRDGRLLARRSGPDGEQLAGSVSKTDEHRFAFDEAAVGSDNQSREQISFFVVLGDDGKPEYLCISGRALKRISPETKP
jgi:CubicO group peptidase (beta-lactamase class C family)